MSESHPPAAKTSTSKRGHQTAHTLLTSTIPEHDQPFSYAVLELATDGDGDPQTQTQTTITLDDLTVKSYLTAALRQFLGLTGQAMAMSIDVLKADGSTCWVRLPREDMGSFAAAVAAYRGARDGETQYLLRVRGSSNWLGLLIGQAAQEEVFRGGGGGGGGEP
ncbi:hypothetical protein E4U41_002132 [Claviceps citrina]|nr:hypothetical protein E4U41_002132 [Claviceps citrina]